MESADNSVRKYLAERRLILRRVRRVYPSYALKKYWPKAVARDDWAVLGVFAERRFLPSWVYESLFARNSWYLNVILCTNPDTPITLLKRMADIASEGIPTAEKLDGQALDNDPSSIRNVALAALRRRL